MKTLRLDTAGHETDLAALLGDEMVEITLFVSIEGMVALERAASERGLTIGQLTRYLLYDYLNEDRESLARTENARQCQMEESLR